MHLEKADRVACRIKQVTGVTKHKRLGNTALKVSAKVRSSSVANSANAPDQ